MNSGKFWVLGLLSLGAVAGLIAVTYWKRPENSVRWSFTQIHTSLVRGKKDAAARFLTPRMTFNGKDLSAAEFLTTYSLDRQTDEIDTVPCPSVPAHWTVIMSGQSYCFVQEGPLWKLHVVGTPPCRCR
ncbi:MAG: hypothetical protein JO332_15845 [Planctomycetaceae bacterium]|nr:hypothetical protein [Planctomycetaceae bacterium]